MHQRVFTSNVVSSNDGLRVHWLRMPVAEIVDRRQHRKIRRANSSFRVVIEDFKEIREDHEELYARYRASITFEGADSLRHSLFDDADYNIFQTRCISVYDGEKLIAGGYFDTGVTSAAAIQNFYDPDYRRYSLGKYLMLIAVDDLRSKGFSYYYPGYLIAGRDKMDYKIFLGKEVTQYYDPETKRWEGYHEGIHLTQAPENDEDPELDFLIQILEEELNAKKQKPPVT